MPRILHTFAEGDIVMGKASYNTLVNHKLTMGDVGEVVYDEYSDSYKVKLWFRGNPPRGIPGDILDFNEDGVAKCKRSDLVPTLVANAQSQLLDSNQLFKLAILYQKYPTPEAEIAALADMVSDGVVSQKEMESLLDGMSFELRPMLQDRSSNEISSLRERVNRLI